MTTFFLNTANVKARLSELIGRVAYGQERLVVLRRGKPVAALVSMPDFRRLEAMDAANTTTGNNLHPIMRAFGGWAERTDLDELEAEIYRSRAVATGREVTL